MLSLKIVAPFAVGAGLFSACIASAEDVSPGMEANRFLEAHQKIPDIGPTPFGESINLYTGELSFRQTDIRLEGKGPAIVIARTTRSSQDLAVLADGVIDAAFGTWDLSVPRIETILRTARETPAALLARTGGVESFRRINTDAAPMVWFPTMPCRNGGGESSYSRKKGVNKPS